MGSSSGKEEGPQGRFSDFEAKNIDGDVVAFSKYDGAVALVVNVASE